MQDCVLKRRKACAERGIASPYDIDRGHAEILVTNSDFGLLRYMLQCKRLFGNFVKITDYVAETTVNF